MGESGAFFEVADREFDYCVVTVKRVGSDGTGIGVRCYEGVVTPIGPEFELGGIAAPAIYSCSARIGSGSRRKSGGTMPTDATALNPMP